MHLDDKNYLARRMTLNFELISAVVVLHESTNQRDEFFCSGSLITVCLNKKKMV